MSTLPLAGPSSPLRTNSAEVRRVVNWEPIRIESGTGKGGAQTYMKQVAGLRLLANVGSLRALKVSQGRLFAVTADTLLEVATDWTTTSRGGLPIGDLALDDNETQLGIAAGTQGYAFDLLTNTLTVIANWPGSTTVGVIDGFGVLTPPLLNKFYLTAIQDFSTIDPLDFASAESSTGNVVSALVKHRQLLLLKERSGEVWYDAGAADFSLARDDSAVIGVGCAARDSLREVGGVAYWVGRDEKGAGIVFGMLGYEPQRVSSDALEEKLATLTDLSGAKAWVYHQEGQSRYVLNVPGLETTWVYNVAAGLWHERAEWVAGEWAPWRPICHAFAFGKHIVGDAAGNLYELDPTYKKNGADPLRRDWISPHNATPQISTQRFNSFEVICDMGEGLADGSAATMLMRYSNDGGQSWESWLELSLGVIGDRRARARETMLGSAEDRVWEIVVTDDVRCNVVSALVNE